MLSILKFVGSTVWNWSTKEVNSAVTLTSSSEEKIKGEQQKWSFEGKVTKINPLENYGLVGNSVFFSFDAVSEGIELCVGDLVCVQATRKDINHSWVAYSVSLSNEKWDLDEANKAGCKATRVAKINSASDTVKEGTRTLTGTVTSVHGTYGIMNNSIPFNLKDCREQFCPMKGDHITALMSDFGDKEVVSWWPTSTRCLQGVVTYNSNTCGMIDNEVIFYYSSCKCDMHLSQGMKVCAFAVQSKQDVYNWRATVISEPEQIEQLRKNTKQLLDDKKGIVITNPLEFEAFLFQKKFISAQLQNMLSVPLHLLNYYFLNPGSSSDFSFGEIKIKNECDNEEKYLLDSVSQSSGGVFIPPKATLFLNIHCKAQTVGFYEDRLVFEFDDFCVCRHVKCNIEDPVHTILKPTAPYECKKRERAKEMRNESLFFIPGEKPYYPKGRFAKGLPSCPVPISLWKAVQDHAEITDFVPCLLNDITMDNYIAKFKCLLHLEEIQAVLDMREFNMPKVCLYKRGELLSLEVPGLAEGRPSLLVGDRVMLFPPDIKEEIAYEGYIHEVHQSEVLLKFNESFHARYDSETYDVSFHFNRSNFKRCHHAIVRVYRQNPAVIFPQLLKFKECLVKELPASNPKEVLNSKSSEKRDLKWFNDKLNTRQKESVRRILQGICRPTPYVIFGPPGTGKTITLVEAALQTYVMFKNSRIVICAPSNSAADLVVQRLLDSDIVGDGEVVRLNSYQRNVESIPDFIKPLCQDKNNVENAIKYPIIVSTCSTASAIFQVKYAFNHFTHIFIDEAGQATEPESLLAISLLSQNSGQVVLSGDPYQLGPVLRSKFATNYGLQTSYLERLIHSDQYQRNEMHFGKFGGYNPLLVTMLVESYRSHPHILEFPSRTFYFSELICGVSKDRKGAADGWKMLPKQDFPLIFHGVQGEELREENSPSWFNPVEVMQVVMYLQSLYEHGLKPEQVGIITPYRKQVEKIKLLISTFRLEPPKIGSVEEFQGQERTVIIISTVRSNNELAAFDKAHNLGFLSNPKRTNVAITRAQDLLIVIGNPHVLQNDYYWKAFMVYVISHGGYVGCDLPSSLEQ